MLFPIPISIAADPIDCEADDQANRQLDRDCAGRMAEATGEGVTCRTTLGFDVDGIMEYRTCQIAWQVQSRTNKNTARHAHANSSDNSSARWIRDWASAQEQPDRQHRAFPRPAPTYIDYT